MDTGLIPQASLDDQTSELQGLGLSVFNQDEFEQGVCVCMCVCPCDCSSVHACNDVYIHLCVALTSMMWSARHRSGPPHPATPSTVRTPNLLNRSAVVGDRDFLGVC